MHRSSGRRRRRRRGCPPVRPAVARAEAARRRRPGIRRRRRERSVPASERGCARIGFEQVAGSDDEVVEVEGPARGEQLGVGREVRHRPRPAAAAPRSSRPRAMCRDARRRADRARRHGEHGAARHEGGAADRRRGSRRLAASRRTCRARACSVRISIAVAPGTLRTEPSFNARREVLAAVAVEGDDADPLGRHAPVDQHGEARDHRRRLAAAGRGDDLGRAVGQRRRGPLLRIKGTQDRRQVEMGQRRRRNHRHMVGRPDYRGVTCGLSAQALFCAAPCPPCRAAA